MNFFNCSFFRNSVNIWYFGLNKGKYLLKGCYLDIVEPGSYGTVIITENTSLIYHENHNKTSDSCLSKFKYEPTSNEGQDDAMLVNNRRHNNMNMTIFLASFISS